MVKRRFRNKRHLSWKKIPLFLFIFFLMMFILFEYSGLLTLEESKELISSSGIYAAPVIISLLIVDIILPIPSSVVMIFSGNIYGLYIGSLINLIGSLAAASIAFFIFRSFNDKVTYRLLDKKERASMNRWYLNWGEFLLIISRMLPMLTETISCFAGLTKISFKRFFFVVLIGTVPVALYYAYFGSRYNTFIEFTIPLAAGIIVPGVFWLIIQQRLNKKSRD